MGFIFIGRYEGISYSVLVSRDLNIEYFSKCTEKGNSHVFQKSLSFLIFMESIIVCSLECYSSELAKMFKSIPIHRTYSIFNHRVTILKIDYFRNTVLMMDFPIFQPV